MESSEDGLFVVPYDRLGTGDEGSMLLAPVAW
jgi:hypothetical protein